jgi:hypothetical protein
LKESVQDCGSSPPHVGLLLDGSSLGGCFGRRFGRLWSGKGDNEQSRSSRRAYRRRGTQTDHGDRIVERLLTTRETRRLQGHRLHEYFTAAITANLQCQPIPALLPPT